MQIQQQGISSSNQLDRQNPIREGDIYRATVKERIGQQEAIVSIRGRDISVKFDGTFPDKERVHVQVTDSRTDTINVRVSEEQSKQANSDRQTTNRQGEIQQRLQQLGVKQPSSELIRAALILEDRGIALSKSAAFDLQQFLQQGNGNERLQTVQALANKRLEVTVNHLRAVDEALHGRPINQVLVDLANELDRQSSRPSREQFIQQNQRAVQIEEIRQLLQSDPKQAIERLARVTADVSTKDMKRLTNEARQLLQVAIDRVLQVIPQSKEWSALRQQLQESGMTEAIREQLSSIEGTNREQINRAVTQAVQLQQNAHDRIHQVISQLERSVTNHQANASVNQDLVQQILRTIETSSNQTQIMERVQSLISQEHNRQVSSTHVAQLVENVRQLIGQGRPEEAIRQITAVVQGEGNRVSEASPSVQPLDRQTAQQVQEIIRQIQMSPNSQQAVEKIQALLSNRTIELSQVQQLVDSVRQYMSQGRVEAAIQQVGTFLSQMDSSSNSNVSNVQTSTSNQLTNAVVHFVEQAKQLLQSEPNVKQIVEQLQARIEQLPLNEGIKVNVSQQLVGAEQKAQVGREMKARQEVAQVIQQIEQQIQQPTLPNREVAYVQNELFQTSQQAPSKMIAVTTVTEKMAQLTADFKQFQREMHRTLDQTARLIDQFRQQANVSAKPLLEKTISRLDQTILKSEMMLFTDMKTERELMQASNRLAEAKQLLAKGSYREANQIVREVSQLVEKVQFQPSETKVKHYTAARDEALRSMQLPEQALTRQLNETLRPMSEPSPRVMLELLRSLGLNRDQELAQQFVSGNRDQAAEQQNLKSLLMQLSRGEEEGTRTQQLANQALNNVTGQQLLSRTDQQSMQSLFFQLPFLLEEKVENLKVFVNSRNEGEKVDWENCSIYFLMQTPKMGDIGILVSVKDRQLSVTLKNDQADFQAKMEPLVQQSIENLGELGFQIKGIHYSPLQSSDEAEEKGNDHSQQRATFTEKGFDFRI